MDTAVEANPLPNRELAEELTEFAVFTVRLPGTRSLSAGVTAALSQLDHDSGCRLSDLSAKLCISLSAASRLVDRLVVLGFARRTRGERDGRTIRITITSAGRQALREQRAHRAVRLALLLDRLDQDDLDQITRAGPALTRLIALAADDAT